MAILAWTMMGLALWHFTVFVPDRFWGGIVGAFFGAVAGSILIGWMIAGFSIPGREATDIAVTLYAVPGSLAGMAAVYAEGVRRENAARESGIGI